jgi:hypothetical protein
VLLSVKTTPKPPGGKRRIQQGAAGTPKGATAPVTGSPRHPPAQPIVVVGRVLQGPAHLLSPPSKPTGGSGGGAVKHAADATQPLQQLSLHDDDDEGLVARFGEWGVYVDNASSEYYYFSSVSGECSWSVPRILRRCKEYRLWVAGRSRPVAAAKQSVVDSPPVVTTPTVGGPTGITTTPIVVRVCCVHDCDSVCVTV